MPVVDVWTALWEAVGKDERKLEQVLSDGLHLNAAGYDVVFKALAETLEREFPELKPEMTWRKYKHPTWDWFSQHGFEGWEERQKQIP